MHIEKQSSVLLWTNIYNFLYNTLCDHVQDQFFMKGNDNRSAF